MCFAIVQLLLPQYVHVLTGIGLRDVIDDFKTKHGFPQCAGAVDGMYETFAPTSASSSSHVLDPLSSFFLLIPLPSSNVPLHACETSPLLPVDIS